MQTDLVPCRHPARGRTGTSPVPRWKFEAVRRAILSAVREAGPEGLPFSELAAAVEDRLDERERSRIAKIGWITTTVKLELEAAGEIRRAEGVIPQQLHAG